MLARGELSGMIPMTLTPDLRTILTLSIRADVVPDCEIAKTTSSFESELADINCMCGSEINDDEIFNLKNLCCAFVASIFRHTWVHVGVLVSLTGNCRFQVVSGATH